MKEITRININNATKVITITNEVFETLTNEEEKKITKYQSVGYELSIVDNPKRVSENVKLTNNQIIANAVVGSRELKFKSEEESREFLNLYNDIKKSMSFQTAKGFYLEVKRAVDHISDRSVEDVYNYYNNLVMEVA